MIAAAKGALIEFAKTQFGDLLNFVWKWPFWKFYRARWPKVQFVSERRITLR